MNKGIEELEAFIPEIQRRKEENFFKKLCRKFLEEENITPIRKKLDSPYLIVRMSFDDFRKSNNFWIGNKPDWDLNWGHMFWCVECVFHWKVNEVTCLFQNENENLNRTRIFGNRIKPLTIHTSIRYPPSIMGDW